MADAFIDVEVVYAAVDRQCLLSVRVPNGCSVHDAVVRSGIAAQFPEANVLACPMGIFGKAVADPAGHVLEEGDRVEIYRPLIADPKEVRRMRAAKAAKSS
ncbi:RnfH family protein [Pseudomonas sp.]|uniref:RnfH family protein n=1 Tax=Pseudomonas sp. TaxID=306 RepID=UPI003CC6CE04